MQAVKPGWLRLAAMLQQMPADAASRMIAQIAASDPALAQWLDTQRVSLSQVLQLPLAARAQVVACCDERCLLLVLRGLDDTDQAALLGAVSRRRGEALREALMLMPRVPRSDVARAQQSLLNAAVELVDAGRINLRQEPML